MMFLCLGLGQSNDKVDAWLSEAHRLVGIFLSLSRALPLSKELAMSCGTKKTACVLHISWRTAIAFKT
jgi:hypothetical protein